MTVGASAAAGPPGAEVDPGLQEVADAHEAVRRGGSSRKAWERLYGAQRRVEDTRLATADALAAGGDPEAAFWAVADLLQPGLGNLPGENYR